MAELSFFEGGVGVDDRGKVGYVNDFNFAGVKRFYWVSNHRSGFVRAWHAHRLEAKYVTVVQGSALIGAVEIDDWENPSKDNKVWRYVLNDHKPSVLHIPAGFANGFMSLTEDTKLIFFSTSTLEETHGDDIRFDSYYWNPWEIIER